jgi:hypothetical protein
MCDAGLVEHPVAHIAGRVDNPLDFHLLGVHRIQNQPTLGDKNARLGMDIGPFGACKGVARKYRHSPLQSSYDVIGRASPFEVAIQRQICIKSRRDLSE